MRPLRLIPLLAVMSFPLVTLHAEATYQELYGHIHPGEIKLADVSLQQLVENPQSLMNVRVRLRCFFVESGQLFDTQRTMYKPDLHINMIAYDQRAAVWDPAVRAQPMTTMFMAKERPEASIVPDLKKWQIIEVIGEVLQIVDGVGQFSIEHIQPVTDSGGLSDGSIYHVEQGNAMVGENAYDLAEDHFVAALKDELPVYDRILVSYLRAKNLMLWGHFADCAQVLHESLALVDDQNSDRTTQAAMHYLLAKSMAETGTFSADEDHTARFTEAVGHAREAVRLDPEQGDAYAVLGITLAGMGQFDEARRQCEKAIRLRPNNAEVRWYLGRILDAQGSYEEAIEALRKAIDLTPKDHRIHKAIAAVYYHRGIKGGPKAADDLVTALREYDISIRLDQNDPEAFFGSGQVLEAATDAKSDVLIDANREPATYELAEKRFLGAVAIDPKFLPARRELVNRYRKDNQPDQAIEQLKAIATNQPDRVQNFFDLGEYQLSLGRKDDAVATFEQCRQLHPNSLPTLAMLGRLALDMGAYAKGVASEEEILKIEPKNGTALLYMAKFKLQLGLAKEALSYSSDAEANLVDDKDKAEAQSVHQKAEAALATSGK